MKFDEFKIDGVEIKINDEYALINGTIKIMLSQISEVIINEPDWLGVGLIKGYGWYDETSGTIKYGTNGMKDVTADGMFNAAVEKGPISTMPDIPGIAVWHQGHIGVYIGNGYVIHAANTYDGVIKTPITSSGWTHWLKVPYINYIEETEDNPN